jgi:anti-sigma factor RsiW
MLDERTRALVHAQLDGEIAASDSEALEQMLAADDAVRAYYDEMRELSDTLATLPQADPPAVLRRSVLAAIRPAKRTAAPRPPRAFLNYGYAFAAGALLASLALLLTPRSEPLGYDMSELVGTMNRPTTPAATVPVNMARIDLDAIEGTVNVFRSDDAVIVDFDMLARAPVELSARFGTGSPPRLLGVAPRGQEALQLTTAPGSVTVAGDGQHRYALILADADEGETRIDLAFRSGGHLIHETSLSLAAKQQ